MKEGFIIGGGLIALGLLLQAALGPIDWDFFASPVNYIALAVLLSFIGAMYLLLRQVYAV